MNAEIASMTSPFTRITYVLSPQQFDRLQHAKVLVFGLGGVGSFVCEALVRSGIGHLGLVDHDVVDITNLNRQLIATLDTVGQCKTEVTGERLRRINPQVQLDLHPVFYPDPSITVDRYDLVIDAIDSVPSKIALMAACEAAKVPLIMSLGTGKRLDPTQLIVTTLYQTSGDPLAKKVRALAKKAGLNDVMVITSTELPLTSRQARQPGEKVIVPSMIFVPASAGLLIAAQAVKTLAGE
jgi:tRNA A37 threonylcarbamoyladenosine dehydratase